jgi:segregation and condensation protein A
MASIVDVPQIPQGATLDGRLAFDKAMGGTASIPVPEGFSRDNYRVLLPNFEGPLDLLLHLIRKEQLNIYDIPIAKICSAYFEQLELLKQIDVNIAGEFMVMAATLTLLKSAMILPREGGDEENDPRLPLVAQLLEYERFKRAANQLDARPWLGRDVYGRPMTTTHDILPVESLLDGPIEQVDTYQLLLCLRVSLDRTERPPLNITTDPVSLREKVELARDLLAAQQIIDFAMLLPEICKPPDVIVSFMAILEMAKLKFVEIIQLETFGKIQIREVRSLRELNESMLDQY